MKPRNPGMSARKTKKALVPRPMRYRLSRHTSDSLKSTPKRIGKSTNAAATRLTTDTVCHDKYELSWGDSDLLAIGEPPTIGVSARTVSLPDGPSFADR